MAHLYLGDTMQTRSHKPTRVLETKSKVMGFLFMQDTSQALN